MKVPLGAVTLAALVVTVVSMLFFDEPITRFGSVIVAAGGVLALRSYTMI